MPSREYVVEAVEQTICPFYYPTTSFRASFSFNRPSFFTSCSDTSGITKLFYQIVLKSFEILCSRLEAELDGGTAPKPSSRRVFGFNLNLHKGKNGGRRRDKLGGEFLS